MTPDPSNPINQAAFKDGAIKEFERHSRLGFIDEDGFYAEVKRLRKLGFKRITLKTGAYGLRELAMAIKWGSKAKIDLLTIDGAARRHRHEPLAHDGGVGHAQPLPPCRRL